MTRTPATPVTPAVVRWAREDAGFTREELGRKAGVGADRVAAWESGDQQPSLAQTRSIADALRRSVAFFLTQTPPAMHTPQPPDFRASSGDLSPALRREIRAATDRRLHFLELAGQDFAFAWTLWRDDPPRDAAAARARLAVGYEQIAATDDALDALKLWIAAVEAQGVLVFQMSRVPVAECRGFALDDPTLPVIVLNGADAPQARAFTLLHELGHLVNRTGALCLLEDRRRVERTCNVFAAEVLLPTQDVSNVVAGLDGAARVDVVARQFRVSPMAAALRLRGLGLVAQSVVDATAAAAAEAGRVANSTPKASGGPPPAVLKRRNFGEPYVAAVLDALHRDSITVLDAVNFLDTKVSVLERLEQGSGGRQ